MSKQRSHELPKEIIDLLREAVAFTGNKKAVDEDPVKVLSMLLYGIGRHVSLGDGELKFIVRRYCSAEGIALYSHNLHEKKIA